MVDWRLYLCLFAGLAQILAAAATTDSNDFIALQALKGIWTNAPPNWVGVDPCGNGWEGISCTNSRVVSITLAGTDLRGQLSSDINKLSELQILDLSYNKGMTGPIPSSIENLEKLTSLILVGCGFSGPIPWSIGSLQQLVYLSLNSNNFIGEIPPSIGNLSNLYWLDLADNKLSGALPVSNGSTPGLDMLLKAKHFHLGKNQISGEIPPRLFNSNLTLIHLLLENNQLTGSIPSTMGLVQNLEVVRLDRNSLSGLVPRNLNNLISVQELDISNNSFDPADIPPWFSSLKFLTSLVMENTRIQGGLPSSLFSLFQLQTVKLKNNRINGTLNISSGYSNQLQLIDLQNNFIDSFPKTDGYGFPIILVGNPICDEVGTQNFCTILQQSNPLYSTPAENCMPLPCNSDQVSSPKCKCAYPYTGTLFFRAPSFSNFGNSSIYESLQQALMKTFLSNSAPVDSLSLSNPTKDVNDYLLVSLQVFPSNQEYFNRTGISRIGFILSNQTFKPPRVFGPFFFIGTNYAYFGGQAVGDKKKSNTGIIVGVTVGIVLVSLLVLVGFCVILQRRRAERAERKNNPFASWDPNTQSGAIPQLKGARSFSFEELKKCTNGFSEANVIGSGGYGKVYRGNLLNGQLVAIKRAQQGSMQGALEFKTEIELLSRVHHKNVVGLVGFCFDQGEQMLVYEYIANGTLKDNISGKLGITLDWVRRLRIALGAGRGLQYLHDLADPPIIHRDVKPNNILLDDNLNAKVADFGLSKLLGESDKTHITTQVKGTLGYLDPEYYMTQQLNDKSDVYSFGILLLELATARNPIEKGKHIVREIRQIMDKTKHIYNLESILDPIVSSTTAPRSVEKFIDLAMNCVEDSSIKRPTMREVVKEIENILELAGMNPNTESASSSTTYEGLGKGTEHPYGSDNLFDYSGAYPTLKVEPK